MEQMGAENARLQKALEELRSEAGKLSSSLEEASNKAQHEEQLSAQQKQAERLAEGTKRESLLLKACY